MVCLDDGGNSDCPGITCGSNEGVSYPSATVFGNNGDYYCKFVDYCIFIGADSI